MTSIVSPRTTLDDRNPIVSFVVNVPPERWFEVACATDPALLRPEYRGRRTQRNFYSSRGGGLLRAPAGHATVLVEPSQVLRFAGASKLYYALGTYTGADAEDAVFSVAPTAPESAPCIRISPDFTGRTLDRARLGRAPADARYGDPAAGALVWGADLTAARLGGPMRAEAQGYDDGFDPGLWGDGEDAPGGREPDGDEDAAAVTRMGGRAAYRGTVEPALAEPDGYEDAPDMRRAQGVGLGRPVHAARYGIVEAPALAEPGGYEDAPDMRRAMGAGYGDPRRRPARAMTDAAPPGDATVADHHPDFDDDPDPRWTEGAPVTPLGDEVAPLDDAAQLGLVRWTAEFESGRTYDAVNPNRDGQGLSWGIVQFSQRSGSLGRLLATCREAARERFDALVGGPDIADELLTVVTAATPDGRLAPVRGNPLWSPSWGAIFQQLGAAPEVVRCQNVAAVQFFLKPNLRFARWMGFDTDRALALLYDRCVHMGNGGGTSWVASTAFPLAAAERAAALKALGHDSVEAFQRSRAPRLTVDGRWGPRSHAALLDEARRRPSAGVKVPDLATMFGRLRDDAAARAMAEGERAASWANISRRVGTILDDARHLADTRFEVPDGP